MTRMFGDFVPVPNVSDGAAREGYHPTQNITILKALYYLSRHADAANLLPETPINGVAGQVSLPMAGNSSAAAPTIVQPLPPPPPQPAVPYGQAFQGGYYGIHVVGQYNQAECLRYDDFDYENLQFEPWKRENCLGPKTWIGRVLPDQGSLVVLKLWDAWKFDAKGRDHEAEIYLHLKSLWGSSIPALHVKSPLEYFHALILQYVKVSILKNGL